MSCIIFLLIFSELFDRIVAIVGDKIITQRQLEEVRMFFPTNLSEKEVLNSIIEQKLLLISAERETIIVDEEEVQSAVENAILEVRGRFPSDSAYYSELERAGLTEKLLREKYTNQLRENLIIQKFIQKKFGENLIVTDVQGITFYNEYKDSLEPIPAGGKFYTVEINYPLSDKSIWFAESLSKSIMNKSKKEKFSSLAVKYSDDVMTKNKGGEVGMLNINDLSSEFIEIKDIKESEIKLVKTKSAYYIIKCNMRAGDVVNLSRIMIKIKPAEEDSEKFNELKYKVKLWVKNEEKDSIINLPNANLISSGDGFIPLSQTPFNSIEEIEVGKVYVFDTPTGLQIIKPIEVSKERMPTWEEVKYQIKNFLYQKKLERYYKNLVNKLMEEIFVKTFL